MLRALEYLVAVLLLVLLAAVVLASVRVCS